MANSWINKIVYKKNNDTNDDKTFLLGVTFDQVYDTAKKNFSLAQLADTLKTFFSRPGFMIYSNTNPNNNSNIVEFYSISGDTENIASQFQDKQ